MVDREELRKDLVRDEDGDPLAMLGGRLIPRYDPPARAEWSEVATFRGLYPGSVDYHIGFPPDTGDRNHPTDLTVMVQGVSPFGKLRDGKVETQWLCGAWVFDGCLGMPDTERGVFDDLMSQVMFAVARLCLDDWRP